MISSGRRNGLGYVLGNLKIEILYMLDVEAEKFVRAVSTSLKITPFEKFC